MNELTYEYFVYGKFGRVNKEPFTDAREAIELCKHSNISHHVCKATYIRLNANTEILMHWETIFTKRFKKKGFKHGYLGNRVDNPERI